MDIGIVVLVALALVGLIGVVGILVRRERLTRRLSEHHGPEYADDQADARAAAHAAQMGRGDGWSTP